MESTEKRRHDMKAIFGMLFALVTVTAAQELARVSPEPPTSAEAIGQDDPGQALYKKGYAAILSKKWDEARKSFAELTKSYPKSKYVDAAQYWTAYSYKQTDQKKAKDLYAEFLEQYRKSDYFDDAVADFDELNQRETGVAVVSPTPLYMPAPAVVEPADMPEPLREGRPVVSPSLGIAVAAPAREIDPAVQLKMDAVHALGANPDDAQAYETVKSIALDTKQPPELREAALETLSRFKTQDPVALYLQIAASGDVKLRQSAIYGIGNTSDKGDDRAIKALWGYARDPKQPREIREASLVALSRIDQTGMIENLGAIARTDPDQALRVHAVYMIGRAGKGNEQQAVAILKGIATDGSQPNDVRESAVQSLSLIKSDEALALLKSMATGSQDKKLRLNALYALARYQDEPSSDVEQTLRGIASNRREDAELRLAALYALRNSAGTASRDLFTSLALKDENQKIQQTALYLLIQANDNKAALLSTLIEVFEKKGDQDRELREAALYGIANVGNDEAVSYLAGVAKTHPDYEIRRRAVYYLGSIGGEKAKAALLDILKQN
jgi:HEAT repeat protein